MLGWTVLEWAVRGSPDFDRRYDLHWLRDRMPMPVVGCATLCACAGWATSAPVGKYRFSSSLAILFSTSVLLWFVLGSMELTPRHYKGEEHPPLYPSEVLVFFGPPVLATVLLTTIRMRGGPRSLRPREPSVTLSTKHDPSDG
jgi:hypothetical protein